jgi:hypothetical protein
MPQSDFLSRIGCSCFIITCSTYSSLKDCPGSPELPIIPNVQHAMLYNPEAALYDTCLAHHKMGAARRGTLSFCLCKIFTRLNHFSLCLRPVSSRPSCLTFGVNSAYPMFTTRWLTYLAGAGLSLAGIIDLDWPHTPLILLSTIRR